MKTWMKSMIALAAFAGFALSMQQARAGCGMTGVAGMKPMAYLDNGQAGPLHAEYFSGGRAGLVYAGFFNGGPFNTAAITGLWKFEFVVTSATSDSVPQSDLPPPGALADSGFVVWHDDGTELMNSGRAPVTGSFCEGVWKQTGWNTYTLNHWALSWVPMYSPGQTTSWSQTLAGSADNAFAFVGPTNIRETITLSKNGQSYSGTFVLTQYLAKDVKPALPTFDTSGGVQLTITGTVSATRITP
jgi:hypothetical protein